MSEGDKWDDSSLPSERATEINRNREGVYGDPAENMRVFAELISPILGMRVSPCQAATILVQLKVMREAQGGYIIDYPDNLEDMCGFTNVLYKTKERYGGSRRPAQDRGPQPIAEREE